MASPATLMLLDHEFSGFLDNLIPQYPRDVMRNAVHDELGDKIEGRSAEIIANEIEQWKSRNVHTQREAPTEIPHDECAAVFLVRDNPGARAAFAKKYPKGAAHAAKLWQTDINDATKIGIDPERRSEKKETKPVLNGASNPWHKDYKTERPYKDQAERTRLVADARASVIRLHGTKEANRLALAAGVTLSGSPLRK